MLRIISPENLMMTTFDSCALCYLDVCRASYEKRLLPRVNLEQDDPCIRDKPGAACPRSDPTSAFHQGLVLELLSSIVLLGKLPVQVEEGRLVAHINRIQRSRT